MSNVSRLPGPSADVWDWQRNGACRGRDSAQFFHPDGERGASRLRREIAAKAVCQACPVRAECAAHALTAREPYGVWGGFTEAERGRILASGWDDIAARMRGRVDVHRLEVQLGLTPRTILRDPPRPRRTRDVNHPAVIGDPLNSFIPRSRGDVTPRPPR